MLRAPPSAFTSFSLQILNTLRNSILRSGQNRRYYGPLSIFHLRLAAWSLRANAGRPKLLVFDEPLSNPAAALRTQK